MSADAAWKLSLPCTRAEAEAIAAAEPDLTPDATPDVMPDLGVVLMTSEVDPGDEGPDGRWRLDAYFQGEPPAALVARVRELVPSSGWSNAVPLPLADQDWVTMSQAGLEPIREGRFVVHTDAHVVAAPAGGRAFLVNAGQAFGTGHHHTTAGCLAMIDALDGTRVSRAIDLGTGTGLLAFAVRHRWPDAAVAATDIDPIAIAVTRANMAANGVEGIDLLVADGARDPAIVDAGPYDLVVANILAGPLIAMAPEVAAIAAPGAVVVLAGLLATQADAVADAYRAQGCRVAERMPRGDWTILRLEAGAAAAAGAMPAGDRDGWARDE